jgi:dihydropyrimidinase
MPGGIDPHTHLEMPFMGTYSTDDFSSGTRAALSGGTTMVVDFCLPVPGQSLLEARQAWDNKSTKAACDYSFHQAITWWGEQVFDEMATVVDSGINTFKHFMAYKGALMRCTRRSSVARHSAACPWCTPRTAISWHSFSRC